MKNLKFLIVFLIIASCSNESLDNNIAFDVFEKQSIRFQVSSEEQNDQTITLGSGRLILKTIQLPQIIIIAMLVQTLHWFQLETRGINQDHFLLFQLRQIILF